MSVVGGNGDDRALLAAVARAHFIDERPHVEIADELGISRFKVARLLSRAREEGMVTITINDWGLPDPVLSARLKDALGLAECHVVRSHGDTESVRAQLGEVAAAHLGATLQPDEVVGLAWGRTLTATTSRLRDLPPLTFVQLTGFVAGDLGHSPIEVARQAANAGGGRILPIFAPLFPGDPDTAAALRKHPDITAAIDAYPTLTTALLSVGCWNPVDTQVRDVVPVAERARAIAGGCVADIAGILVDARGEQVDPAFQDSCINIRYDQLQAVPRVVAVAGGATKAPAVTAVARSGLITELVTDHTLALAVLEGTPHA